MNKLTDHLIEFISGLILTAVFIWFCGSCLEIGFCGYASDLNAIKILWEVTQ